MSFDAPIVTINGRPTDGNQQFTRDQAIAFAVTFYDTSGNVDNPASANLTLSYAPLNGDCAVHTQYDLTQVDDVWSYTWDSSGSERGAVFGHVVSDGNTYAIDFNFRLTASKANRDLAGDDEGNGYCP
jgi:hypothetical protein